MSDKSDKGPGRPGKGASGPSSGAGVVEGLQSVMAVIGENYDPAVGGAADKATESAGTQTSQGADAGNGLLTDKIDAARAQGQGTKPSVTQGLQSIMAVIGENYEEEPDIELNVPENSEREAAARQVGERFARHIQQQSARKITEVAPQDRSNREAKSAISDLVPLLTEDEQEIAAVHSETGDGTETENSRPMTSSSAATGGFRAQATMNDLLTQLKADISTLERGTTSTHDRFNMPDAIDSASTEMKTLLAELQGDISALRQENETLKRQYAAPAPTLASTVAGAQGGGEIASLLNQLQGDIAGLRQENNALRSRVGAAPGGDSELARLLAQLQGDIVGLRRENDNYKYAAANQGTSLGQAFLMSVGIISLVVGAGLGGMYFATSRGAQGNDNFLALLGLKDKPVPPPVAVQAPPPVVKKVVVVEAPKPKPKPKPQKVAVATPPPAPTPPPLPKLSVRRMKLDSAEVQALLADAENLIELGDLVSARQMLEYAMSQKSANAAFRLGNTYDPLYLAKMASVLSVEPNLIKAKVLYYSAARLGHREAARRLAELRRTTGN